jgi:SAM-dependent methyltransferase
MFQKDYWERDSLDGRRPPQHPVIAAYVVPKIKAIMEYVPLSGKTTLLDVGCGNGFFTYYFERFCDAAGLDYSQKMLDMNPVKKKHLMDVNDMKFPDGSFDVVFCHAMLHHVEDMDRVVREMGRVSRRYVVILEPNRNNPFMFLFSLLVREERKALRFSPGYLRGLASRNGLRVVASFSYGMIVPNKTPESMLPFFRLFDFKQPFGMTNFVIAEKT